MTKGNVNAVTEPGRGRVEKTMTIAYELLHLVHRTPTTQPPYLGTLAPVTNELLSAGVRPRDGAGDRRTVYSSGGYSLV